MRTPSKDEYCKIKLESIVCRIVLNTIGACVDSKTAIQNLQRGFAGIEIDEINDL